MWVSTGKAGTPKACAMTTLAVLCPTPGRASSSSNVRGTSPPWRSTRISDSRWMFFDLAGASPHGRMIRSMSRGRRLAIAAGVDARANRSGAVRLTRTSVHCAERTTDTRSVNASSWTSGMGGRGNSSSSWSAMRAALAARPTRRRGCFIGGDGNSATRDVERFAPSRFVPSGGPRTGPGNRAAGLPAPGLPGSAARCVRDASTLPASGAGLCSSCVRRLVPILKLAALAAAAVLLVRVIRSADLDRVADLLRGGGPWMALVVLPFLAGISVDTLAWKIILASLPRRVRFRRLLHMRFATEAVLLSLPMGAVAAVSLKAYLLDRRCGVPAPEGVSSIAAKKNLLMFYLAAFLVTSVAFGHRYLAAGSSDVIGIPGLSWVILAGAFALLLGALLMSVLLVHGSMAERVHRLLLGIPVPVVREWLLRREQRFREVDRSFRPIARDRRRVVAAGALFYLGFLIEAIESYIILRVIG